MLNLRESAVTSHPHNLRIRAHAKINLSLRILARRPDGYHDLRTVFQTIELHDTLHFEARTGPFAIDCDEPGVPNDRGNLVWRAAETLWQHLGREGVPHGVVVRIEKRIPMKGGLGGGSADAAAALVGLARMWDAAVSQAGFCAIARSLGADVPFFLTGGSALGVARGDEIASLPALPRVGVLLVVPAFDVSTADAFRWVDEERERRQPEGPSAPSAEEGRAGDRLSRQVVPRCDWPSPLCEVVNDFEPVVTVRHPEIAEIATALKAAGAAAAAMTGSGSTVFGLFDDEDRMRRAAQVLEPFGRCTVSSTNQVGVEFD